MKRIVTLMAVTVISSTTALAETPAANVADIKTEVLQKVEASIEKAIPSTKEVITDKTNIPTQAQSTEAKAPEIKVQEAAVSSGKKPATPLVQASEVPVIKIKAKKPMMDGNGPHGNVQMMKRPDGPMPEVGIRLPQMNSNMPPKMPMMKQPGHSMKMMKNPQGNMPRMIGNQQQRRMPTMNAPQAMMPMMGSTGMAPNAAPMTPNQGYYMPMMNMQMMHQKQSMMHQHRMRMENHMANIEALLKELVELQKPKK